MLDENRNKGCGYIRLGDHTFSIFAVHSAQNGALDVTISADVRVFIAARDAIIDYVCQQVGFVARLAIRRVLEGMIPASEAAPRVDSSVGFVTVSHQPAATSLAFKGISPSDYQSWFGPIAVSR